MTARRLYTEEMIQAAWNEVIRRHQDTPSYEFQRRFFELLAATKPKEKAVLFTRDELLAVASTHHEKVMIYGIFAMCGTTTVSEAALMTRARQAGLGGSMEIMIRLAKAKKEEDFQPGDVVRDANGTW